MAKSSYRADDLVLGFQHHRVVGGIGNRAAGAERGQAPRRGRRAGDGVAVQPGGTVPRRVVKPSASIRTIIELFALRRGTRGAAHSSNSAVSSHGRPPPPRSAVPARRAAAAADQRIQFAAPHTIQQCHRFGRLIAGKREQAAFGRGVDGVAGTADTCRKVRSRPASRAGRPDPHRRCRCPAPAMPSPPGSAAGHA